MPRTRIRVERFLNERLAAAGLLRKVLARLFPTHWSFLLGEVALFAFVGLVLSGIYLAFFYRPGTEPVVYRGAYPSYDGASLPQAFVTVLRISIDVPFGLVVRRFHHFSAHVFLGAILLHGARVFFTGAFRRPRELTFWLGLGMLGLALVNGFTGYSLPFDVRGGSALRQALTTLSSIPWAGGWLATLAFGQPFPGPLIMARIYILHVLVVPVLIAVLLAGHLGLVVRHTHTDWPGPGRSERFEVGGPAWPDQTARSTSLAFLVLALIAGLSAFFPVEAVWVYGPFRPYADHQPLQPDWFLMFIEGAFRMIPSWLNFHLIGANFTNPFYGAVLLPLLIFLAAGLYPLLDERLYGERGRDHHLLEPWTARPLRAAFGAAGLLFVALLSLGAADTDIADTTGAPFRTVRTTLGLIALFVPPVVFVALLLGLRAQRRRR